MRYFALLITLLISVCFSSTIKNRDCTKVCPYEVDRAKAGVYHKGECLCLVPIDYEAAASPKTPLARGITGGSIEEESRTPLSFEAD